MKRPEILSNAVFYCHHISDADAKDMMNFNVKNGNGEGLFRYLRFKALWDEDENLMRTYLVRDKETDEVVAFFSLKSGHVSTNEYSFEEGGETKTAFSNVPGVEIANLAINQTYVSKYPTRKGSGLMIFNSFIIPLIKATAEIIGVKIAFIFALPEKTLLDNYHSRYGFMRLKPEDEEKLHKRVKPEYDDSCIFMFQYLE